MPESFLIIDIETRPDETLRPLFMSLHPDMEKEKVDTAMATSTDFAEIVCIGIKQFGGEAKIFNSIEQLDNQEMYNLLFQMPLVTYNGKKFDLPLLIKSGFKAGINLPYQRLFGATKKYGYADRHLDLMEILSFNNKWQTLDTYLQIYLGEKKKTIGSDFFKNSSLEELNKHCLEDLSYTEKLYAYFERMF